MTPAAARTLPLHRLFAIKRKISDTRYLVNCPAHEDKRPSCSLRRKKGAWRWRCFSCGASGDIIDLIMLRERIAMPAAIALLVSTFGDMEAPPPESKSSHLLVCAAKGCGNTCDIEPRTYRTLGRRGYEWRTTIWLEALCAAGWEVAPDLIAALCPSCVDKHDGRQYDGKKTNSGGN